MNWEFKELPAFSLAVLEHSFNEENAASGIPEFYKNYRDKYADLIRPHIGVCVTPEFGYDWIYAIGDTTDKPCPDGFSVMKFPTQGWAVFHGKNASEIRNFIYTEWFLTSGYEIMSGNTLEIYDENGNITEILIPAKLK